MRESALGVIRVSLGDVAWCCSLIILDEKMLSLSSVGLFDSVTVEPQSQLYCAKRVSEAPGVFKTDSC